MITGADAFEHILHTQHLNFERDPAVYNRMMRTLFGESILTTEGAAWKDRRRQVSPVYQHTELQQYIPRMRTIAADVLVGWKHRSDKPLNLSTEMNCLALKIAFELLCNQRPPERIIRSLTRKIRFCNRYHAVVPQSSNWLRFRWSLHRMNRYFLQVIEARKKDPAPPQDLLSRILGLHEACPSQAAHMSTQGQLSELKTHLITGHETTATALSWLWYLLALHSDYQRKMQAELDTVLQGRPPNLEDLSRLPLTQAIVQETLRLYPPIWSIARTNRCADVITNVSIPAGSHLLLNILCLHRNPRYWSNPSRFYPERFLEGPAPAAFAYLPFGNGAHRCIANHLAFHEIILLTALMGQSFSFSLATQTAAPIPMLPCITLMPQHDIWLIPKTR